MIRRCWPWSLGRYESVFVLFLFFVFVAAGAFYEVTHVLNLQGDTAMFFDFVNGTRIHGLPITRVNAAINEAVWTWFSQSIDGICRGDLSPPHYDNAAMTINQFSRHAYLLAYPLAFLSFFAPVEQVGSLAHVMIFVSIPFVAYTILRSKGMPAWVALLFSLLVSAHPVLSQGFFSNLYSDRFFMIFALVYAALVHETIALRCPAQRIFLPIFAFGILAASTVERGAAMICIFTVAYLVLYWKEARRHPLKWSLLVFAAALFVWFWVYVKFISQNPELHDAVFSLGMLRELLSEGPLLDGTIKFLAVNLALLLAFAIGNWRLALIAAGAMLPNLLFTVGGAERSGFLTHYHSLYFPFLIFAAVYGFHALWSRMRGAPARSVLAGICAVLALGLAAFSTSAPGVQFSDSHIWRWAPFELTRSLWAGKSSPDVLMAEQKKQIANLIPPGASVTTFEGMMVSLFPEHFIYYYPVGLEQADYAVLGVTKAPDQSYSYNGAIAYRFPGKELDDCLTARLRTAGYNVDDPVIVGQTVILKRQKTN